METSQNLTFLIELNSCLTIDEFARKIAELFHFNEYRLFTGDLSRNLFRLQASSNPHLDEMKLKEEEEQFAGLFQKEDRPYSNSSPFANMSFHYQIINESSSFDLFFNCDEANREIFSDFLDQLKPMTIRFIQIAALENKVQKKSDFLRKAVHDLKNPLSNIIGYLSLMIKYIELGELDPAKMKDDVKHIIRIAEHMTKLVTDLLTIASFEAGKISLGITKVNLFKLVSESLVKVQRICEKKNVQIKKTISIDTDVYAEIDEIRLATAIDELLNHALKFTIDDEIEFFAYQENNYFVIKVSDTVHNLSNLNINDLFNGFIQLQTRTTDGQKPNSFTLLLIRKIVETHNGQFLAEANGEKGASFLFKIPLSQPSA